MGQEEVLNLLEKEKRWMATKEIAKTLGTATSSLGVKLRKLRSRKEIIYKETNKGYLYKIK